MLLMPYQPHGEYQASEYQASSSRGIGGSAKDDNPLYENDKTATSTTRSLSDIDRPPLAENLQMGYQLFYPTHAMEAP